MVISINATALEYYIEHLGVWDGINMWMIFGTSGVPESVISGNEFISLFRAVSPDEFYDIMESGSFNLHLGAYEGKQFGLSFEETLNFAEQPINNHVGAIVELVLPEESLTRLAELSTDIDPTIFIHGVVTIPFDKLDEFNKLIERIVHRY